MKQHVWIAEVKVDDQWRPGENAYYVTREYGARRVTYLKRINPRNNFRLTKYVATKDA